MDADDNPDLGQFDGLPYPAASREHHASGTAPPLERLVGPFSILADVGDGGNERHARERGSRQRQCRIVEHVEMRMRVGHGRALKVRRQNLATFWVGEQGRLGR
jgi:hypothetical protein